MNPKLCPMKHKGRSLFFGLLLTSLWSGFGEGYYSDSRKAIRWTYRASDIIQSTDEVFGEVYDPRSALRMWVFYQSIVAVYHDVYTPFDFCSIRKEVMQPHRFGIPISPWLWTVSVQTIKIRVVQLYKTEREGSFRLAVRWQLHVKEPHEEYAYLHARLTWHLLQRA